MGTCQNRHVEAVLTNTHNVFLSSNKKNNVYPCKPQFYYIDVGFKGSKLYRRVFVMYVSDYDNLTCFVSRVEGIRIFTRAVHS